jgi:hypothetical protein
MRVWDLNPGYLNDQSLLGEHRELHGIVSILANHMQGYSKHPETLRWKECGWALRQRHRLLRAEMSFRGFRDETPVRLRARPAMWPARYIDPPCIQFAILGRKYRGRPIGRIPLPQTTQELWAQHKYSVLARDPRRYHAIGTSVCNTRKREGFCELALELTDLLRRPPETGRVMAALQHMWGHLSARSPVPAGDSLAVDPRPLLSRIQDLAKTHHERYLLSSTALSELDAWM